MDKRKAIIAVKMVGYGAAILILSGILYFDQGRLQVLRFERCLKRGTPEQKEAALELFMLDRRRIFVPAVIDAILDDTTLPRHGDTGWGTVYHQAASAMDGFASRIESPSPWQPGREEYTFGRDIGRASLERRKEVQRNWRRWYAENRNARMRPSRTSMSGWRARYEGHFRLAHIYVRMGDHKAAAREYEKVLENTSPVSEMGRSLVYAHIEALVCLNRDREAKALLAQALERFNSSGRIEDLSDNYDSLVSSWQEYRIKE